MEHLKTIARAENIFRTKFGIPRQSNLITTVKSTIVFEPEFRSPDALRELDTFSHLWLIWRFSEAERDTWMPTVRPPRLGGNTKVGVFATRSPYRPNAIALSSVKLDHIEQHPEKGPVLHVLGADLMNGSPIYDIKPYIPYTDSHPEAIAGFADEAPSKTLKVSINERFLERFNEEDGTLLKEILAHDPRPPYHKDPNRIYGMAFGNFEIKFTVNENVLTVVSVDS